MGVISFLKDISARHERLKKRIHSFRMPLSPTGQKIASVIYFMIPVVGGYGIMQLAFMQAERNIGKNGEKLREKLKKESGPNDDTDAALALTSQIEMQNKAVGAMLNDIKQK